MMGPPSEARRVRLLIDVDVVLDVFTRREPHFADSAALLAACETGRCAGVVAAHTITTLWYLLAKYHGKARAREKTAELLRVVGVAAVDEQVIHAALALDFADFEDAVQSQAAAALGVDYVVTRNLADFSRGPVSAIAPAELLPLLAHAGQ
jgi:predicted nucleic acid-binding protein